MNKELFAFIKRSPTAYHACDAAAQMLKSGGYTEVFEGEEWNFADGG